MKLVRSAFVGLVFILVCGSSAHAAIAQLVCTSSSTTISVNLSYVDLGVSVMISAPGSGAGAGKVQFIPLDVHTASVNFPVFFQNAAQGTIFTSCTGSTNAAGGSFVYNIRQVQIASVEAIARSARSADERPANYTDVKLTYAALEVISNSGTDNGGAN
jgi:hypothetical protein